MNYSHQQILGFFPGVAVPVLDCSTLHFSFQAFAFTLQNTCLVELRSGDGFDQRNINCFARPPHVLPHCLKTGGLCMDRVFKLNSDLMVIILHGFQCVSLFIEESSWMIMTQTGNSKQTKPICDWNKCLNPVPCITEHGSNWKQTSKAHPARSPHAQLHPQQSISHFCFAHHLTCHLKTDGKSRSNGSKTKQTNQPTKKKKKTRRWSVRVTCSWVDRVTVLPHRFHKASDNFRLVCHLGMVL